MHARSSWAILAHVISHLCVAMPEDTIITNGAGNYTVWVHRFYQHRAYRTQLAPTSGSMGYGVPAAVAAKCVHSDRPVVSISGDGCFLMAAQELATCAYEKLNIIHLVVNNGMYGTIRMHQERTYPTRVIGTDLGNPDFVAYAAAFGIPGEVVERTQDFPVTLAHARASKTDILLN